jgi:hypothetical protein
MAITKKEQNPTLEAGSFRTPEENLGIEAAVESESVPEKEQEQKIENPSKETQHKKRILPHRFSGPVLPPLQDPLAQKIEKILEENVGDAYQRLSPLAKQEFKLKGEVTARKISELLRGTHVKVKKIFQLILEWLKMLPGINRFFLEQEAKIKTDRIIALHNRK